MTKLQPMVIPWQGWMQLQRLLCSTNTHESCPGAHTNSECYSICCWWGAECLWNLLPWDICPMLPTLSKSSAKWSHHRGTTLWLCCDASCFRLWYLTELSQTWPRTSATHLRWVFSVFSGDTERTIRFAIAIWLWSSFTQIVTMLWPVCFFPSPGPT